MAITIGAKVEALLLNSQGYPATFLLGTARLPGSAVPSVLLRA